MKKIIITEKDLERMWELANAKRPVRAMMGYMESLFNQASRYTKPTDNKRNERKLSINDSANYYRELLVKNQTEAEKKFKALLKSCDVKYDFQKIFFCGSGFVIADFYIPEKQLVFEIDGGYHNKPIQKVKDMGRTSTLIGTCNVTKVVRITNGEVVDTEACLARIKAEIE